MSSRSLFRSMKKGWKKVSVFSTCRALSQPKRSAFTLIELLLVIGILSLLASIVISAINPQHQLSGARNAQRWSDVTTLLDGFAQYSIDHGGSYLPTDVGGTPLIAECKIPFSPASPRKVCKVTTGHGTGDGQCGKAGEECVWSQHLAGTYLVDIVPDPGDLETSSEDHRVDYTIVEVTGSRLSVSAPNAEGANSISKTR